MSADKKALVAIVMGSKSDWETMQHAADTLRSFEVPHYCKIVSAHRTPDVMAEFKKGNLPEDGLKKMVDLADTIIPLYK